MTHTLAIAILALPLTLIGASGQDAAAENAAFTWQGKDAQIFISALMDGSPDVRGYVLSSTAKDIDIHLSNMLIRKNSNYKYDPDDPHFGFTEVSASADMSSKHLDFTEALTMSYLLNKNDVDLDCDMGGCNYEFADVSCNIHLNIQAIDKRYSCDFKMAF